MDPKRALLRHTCSTVAYRAAKALRDAPPGFATFKVGETTRTPGEILAHMGNVLEWALSMAKGHAAWNLARPRAWEVEQGRFFEVLGRLDAFLKSEVELACTPERMFQGPIADALTHVGQIAMLRRLSGARILAEDYSDADIVLGRVGADQRPPRGEAD